MKRSRQLLSRRAVFRKGAAMLGLALSWRLLPRSKVARVQAEVFTRAYGAGNYGAGAYGASLKVYLPVITK
jgi:hypothetical protein